MLPTILESETLSSAREPHSPNPKSPKKSSSSATTGNVLYSKLAQNRPDISAEGSKSSQVHKRGPSSNANAHFYPNIRYALLSESKTTKPQRHSETLKDSSILADKKDTEEVTDRSSTKTAKSQAPTQASLLPEEHVTGSGVKSLTIDLKQNPRSARDALKAKFKDREQQSGSYSPMAANHYKATSNLGVKPQSITETAVGRLAAKYLNNTKSPSNRQSQQSAKVEKPKPSPELKSRKPGTVDKILLQSSSKQNQVNTQVVSASSNESRSKELQIFQSEDLLGGALKGGSLSTPIGRESASLQNSAVRVSLQKSEVIGSGKGEIKEKEKEKGRSPSPHTQSKKNYKDILSISPVKKGSNATKEKSHKKPEPEKTAEVRKATPVQVFLSEEEKAQYGNRTLPDYDKLELLGKGGFALVWLGMCKKTGRKVAIKQMAKKSTSGNDSKKADLYYGQLLFKEGGEPREEFLKYPGIANIACFIDYKSTKFDDWHISELCGRTLSGLSFDMKGEFNKGERVYAVRHLELHRQFKQDGYSFKAFIKGMAEALDVFSNYYIVHCDIKPENILINTNINDPDKPFQLKIIDFGSAYNWGDSGKVRMATPEYMPPEFLNALIPQNGSESTIEQLAEISKPWSVDVWSLGAVILEIITGIPLWIPLKCKLESGSKSSLKYGLFAVKGRSYDKIYLKQKALVESLGQTLSEYLEGWSDAENLFDLLQNIFKWDPKKRISPAEILQHPYLNS